MKKKITILAFISTICLFANADTNASTEGSTASQNRNVPDMSAYDRQFDAIAKTRVGLNDKEILLLKNPFEIEKDLSRAVLEEEEIDPGLVGKSLNAIVTDRVKINDDWYNLGDYIGSYKIVEIKDKSVMLENEKQSLELKLKQGSQNVIIKIN